MACILVQVRGGLSTVAATFLGFVARPAAAAQASQGRPPSLQLHSSLRRCTLSWLLLPPLVLPGALTFSR